ncbi:MAG: hypothetical protein ACJ8F3_14925 [Xanthobacteraceae bacterium]
MTQATASGSAASAALPIEPGATTVARRSRASWLLRISFEYALLFGIAVVAKIALPGLVSSAYPNPLWLPVIVLSLQHGIAAGLFAAVIALGVQYWEGLPAALLHEDMYDYIGRVAAEPIGWACVALLIGHIRSRQIASRTELEQQLAERSRQSSAVAQLCQDFRTRIDLLERHIAANARASNSDVVQAMSELEQATWETFPQRLSRFVNLMTGATDFSVYLLRHDKLELAMHGRDDHHLNAVATITASDQLFAAILHERRVLCAGRGSDAALLDGRWTLAGPLLPDSASGLPASAGPSTADQSNELGAEAAVGMFAISGALDDFPNDIERRFALTSAQISRLVGYLSLVNRWQSAGMARRPSPYELLERELRAEQVVPPPGSHGGNGRDRRAQDLQRGRLR